LSPDTLICLLSSEGSATFFVVVSQGQKPTRLQSEYDLASDPEHAYVVGKPLDHVAFRGVLSGALTSTFYMQLSLVEFLCILLAALETILEAMQRISENLEMPFSHILAPNPTPDNQERELHVDSPAYATKPGFKFDLSRITHCNTPLYFAATGIVKEAAYELTEESTPDRGQAEAVISCLSRSFAVVQGSPGTGKSYTGVQLIRISLAYKAATKIEPILVCIQTNHALHATLERSVDDGVKNIVRVVGQSESERLKEINFRILAAQLDLTKREKSECWEL
jgi:hypothetical protein